MLANNISGGNCTQKQWLSLLKPLVVMTGLSLMGCKIPFSVTTTAEKVSDDEHSLSQPYDHKNYTFMYFEHGYPTRLAARRGSVIDANQIARDNPDLVFQTGYFSMMFDAENLQISGWDQLSGSDYLNGLRDDVSVFTPASLKLWVEVDGVRYQAIANSIQADNGENFVRVIESGQFKKRIDRINIQFKNPIDGTILENTGALEITAWSDRVVFNLDCSNINNATKAVIEFVDPSNRSFNSDAAGLVASLAISPIDSQLLDNSAATKYISKAIRNSDGIALKTSFDQDTNAVVIDIPRVVLRYPADNDRLDEYSITLTNPHSTRLNLPLVFEEQQATGSITGTTMTLVSDVDGSPLGHNVQVSKNWHTLAQDKFMGPWLRGSTLLTLAPNETKTIRLRVIHGYWAKAPAAHHVQLSVIGWPSQGINKGTWKWDQAALGAWGESITYDPTLHLADSFINDYRPSFTTPSNGSNDHNWTENVGGGNFMIYRDTSDTLRHLKKLKTAYKYNGPNLTEVHYSGITDDDKIRVTYIARLGSTFDYNRNFHSFRYEFLEDVIEPNRFVFYQMAADTYKTARYSNFSYGDNNGLIGDGTSEGSSGYNAKIAFNQGWLAIDDAFGDNGNVIAKANRGLIVKQVTLNGAPLDVYLHQYQSSFGVQQTVFDLSSSDIKRSYHAGDVIEGEIELVLPAKNIENYWGGDNEFASRLATYTNHWQAVFDDARYNDYQVTIHQGQLLSRYPLEISSAGGTNIADFTIENGGLGKIPLIIKNVVPGTTLVAQYQIDGMWLNLEDRNSLTNKNYYQGTLNSDGNFDYVFNIKRPTNDLAQAWRVRVIATAN